MENELKWILIHRPDWFSIVLFSWMQKAADLIPLIVHWLYVSLLVRKGRAHGLSSRGVLLVARAKGA